MEYKVLNLPGGSTKALQIAIAAIIVMHKYRYKPDVITGTSAGAIIALALHLGKFDAIMDQAKNVELDKMFEVIPTDGKGNLSFAAYRRIICSLLPFVNSIHSLGIQNTRHYFTNNISEEEYRGYVMGESPDIQILIVDPTTKKHKFYNLKDLSYREATEVIEMSAHIPVMTEAVNGLGHYGIDGGIAAHNPEWLLYENWNSLYPNDLMESSISIYPREHDFKLEFSEKWKKNVLNNIDNTILIQNRYISLAGQSSAKWYCKANNIDHLQLFCPQILDMDSRYDVDDEQLLRAEEITRLSIEEQIKNSFLK